MPNQNLPKIFFSPKDSIKQVLDRMAKNKFVKTMLPAGVALIVDSNKVLKGIVTDGDMRRVLSSNTPLSTPVGEVMNKKPFLIENPKSKTEVLSLAADKIKKENWHKDRLNKIIIVDAKRRVTDLVSFYDVWQSSDVRFKHIGVVGLGYVGLTMGLVMADLGFKVKGLDTSSFVRDSLKKARPHFFEEGLPLLLKDHIDKNFRVVNNFSGQNNCDVYFIAVGTPLDKNKKPNLSYLKNSAKNIGKILKYGDAVVLRSTVPVGATRSVFVPVLESVSGLRAGEDFFVAFAPERTVQGKAIEELRRLPQVIGGINHASVELVSNIFSYMTPSVISVDSLEEAEMVKLVNNTYRDLTFAFSNELSLICQRFKIDTHRVINAANRDYGRSQVPLPSPGVGGACLEKDPFIFIESAKTKNYEPHLTKRARHANYMIVDSVAGNILDFLETNKKEEKNPKILILGFAFKGYPVTSDTRGSTTLEIVKKIKTKYKNIHGHDPAVSRQDITAHKVKHVSDLKKGFEGADVVLVMNNNPVFKNLDIRSLARLTKKECLLFDAWGLFKPSEVAKTKGVKYKRL